MTRRSGDEEPARPDNDLPPDNARGPRGGEDAAEEEDEGEKLVLVSPASATSVRDLSLWAGVLALFALAVYGPALRGDFLWDDARHISQNPALIAPDGLSNIWTAHWKYFFASPEQRVRLQPYTPQYYPLTHTTYWLEAQIARHDDGTWNTLVFHVTNIVLHAISAILVWLILRKLGVPAAWLAAAVFAVHPMNVESVAWMSERKNVLSAALFFGAILTYLEFAEIGLPLLPAASGRERAAEDETRWDLYGLALALFIGALLSKTITCSMPAVVLVLLWWKRGRIAARDVGLLAPFFVIGAVMAAFTSWIEWHYVIDGQAASGEWNLSWLQRVLIAGRALWFYVARLLVPVKLMFSYPRWQADPGVWWQWVFPVAAAGALVLLWLVRRVVGRGTVAAAFIFTGVLVPALGFFNVYPMRYSFVADHFVYLASPALIALVIALLAIGLRRLVPAKEAAPPAGPADAASEAPQPSPVPYVLSGLLLLALSVTTWARASIFDNSIALWEDTVSKNPTSWLAYNALSADYYELGVALRGQDQADRARESFSSALGAAEQAIRLRPNYGYAHFNKGRALRALGHPAEALAEYDKALSIDPSDARFYFEKGTLLEDQKQYEAALAAYEEAVKRRETPMTLRSKGLMLDALGRNDEAERTFRRALELDPNDFDVRFDLGTLQARLGRREDAANQFVYILNRRPDHVNARISLAFLQMEVWNLAGAQQQLIQATRIIAQNNLKTPARLVQAVELWAKLDRASTQPSTTQSTTRSAATRSAATQAAGGRAGATQAGSPGATVTSAPAATAATGPAR